MEEIYSLVKDRNISTFKTSIYSLKLLLKYKKIFLVIMALEFALLSIVSIYNNIGIEIIVWVLRIIYNGYVFKKIQEIYFKEWEIKYQQDKLSSYSLKSILINIISFIVFLIFYIAVVVVAIFPIIALPLLIIPLILIVIPINIFLINMQRALQYEFVVNDEPLDKAIGNVLSLFKIDFQFYFRTIKLYILYFIYSIPFIAITIVAMIAVWAVFDFNEIYHQYNTYDTFNQFDQYNTNLMSISPFFTLFINGITSIVVVMDVYALLFGFIILYMNKKYNDGENVFPYKFIQADEQISNNDNDTSSYTNSEEVTEDKEEVTEDKEEVTEVKEEVSEVKEEVTEVKEEVTEVKEENKL